MGYYDALVAKWATEPGDSPSQGDIDAAVAALALGEPAQPAADAPQSAHVAWHEAANAWMLGWAQLFRTAAVAAKLAALNAETVDSGRRRVVSITDAVTYLREQGKWLGIKAAAAANNAAAAAVIDLYDDPRAQSLDFTLPIVGQVLAGMLGTGLLDQAQADGLEAMSHVMIPWWQSAGYASPIAETDLEAVFRQSAGQIVLV